MSDIIAIDTCVAVFLYERRANRLSPAAHKLLAEKTIFVPSFVELELTFIVQKGRANHTQGEVLNFIRKDFATTHLESRVSDVCKSAEALSWTREPFDRFIVAEVMTHKLPLITSDRNIQEHYKKAIW